MARKVRRDWKHCVSPDLRAGLVTYLSAWKSSFYPFTNDPLYGAAKHGVLGAVRAIAPRVFREGITANCLGPNIVGESVILPLQLFFRVCADQWRNLSHGFGSAFVPREAREGGPPHADEDGAGRR